MPSANVNDLSFYSGYPIDKIVAQGTVSYTIAGSDNVVIPNQVLETIPNPYGKKTFIASSWSVNGTDFYDELTATYFFLDSFDPKVFDFQAFAGCDDTTIYFFLQNGLQDITNTPIDQTVTINYALFSIS